MIVEAAVLATVAYVGYKEYKSGKLNKDIKEIETRLESLESGAKAEVKKAELDVTNALGAVEKKL